jgi:hypothetical protein
MPYGAGLSFFFSKMQQPAERGAASSQLKPRRGWLAWRSWACRCRCRRRLLLTGRRQDRRRPAFPPPPPPLSLGKFASGVLRCSSAGNIAGVHIEHRHCVPALDSDGIRGVASNLRLCAARGLRSSVISTYVLQDRVNIWMVACEFVVHRYGWAQASWAVDSRPSNTCFQKSSPVLFHTKLDILP